MKQKNIASTVTQVLSEQLGVPESFVTPEKQLIADFGADSLDAVELLMALEDEFGIEIDDDEAEKCRTVKDVISAIERLAA